jgi:hypothetical protein
MSASLLWSLYKTVQQYEYTTDMHMSREGRGRRYIYPWELLLLQMSDNYRISHLMQCAVY